MRVVVGDQYPQFMENIEQIQQVYEGYQIYKEKNFVMDFDDLLEKSVQLLQSNEEVRIKVAAQHRFIMVDEYQDTNKLQATLTQLLSSVHKNVMAVGDDAQSIYAFRGADHRNILEFPTLYDNCTLIKLEENYRSTPQILDVANELLKQAYHKFDKQLFSRKEDSDKPALVKAAIRQRTKSISFTSNITTKRARDWVK